MGTGLKPKTQDYFANLDGLRFVGSFAIMILHVEGLKEKFGRQNIPLIYRYFSEQLPVTLFFVLSGFLITYLLLKEKEESSTINMKKFFTRRILRIWPLYYLILIIGFFILPALMSYFFHDTRGVIIKDHYWLQFGLSVLFLPDLLSAAIGATWSVKVEEFFYVFWPFLIRKTKNYLFLFGVVVVAVVLFRLCFVMSGVFKSRMAPLYYSELLKVVNQYRVNCMAIGGIGAYLVIFDKRKILDILFRKDFQLALYAVTIGMYLLKVRVPLINNEVYSTLFSAIIVNLAVNPDSIVHLRYRWMIYLGKISYGIYLFNPIMRIVAFNILEKTLGIEITGWWQNIFFYTLTISLTVGASVISYEFFEKYFLRKKTYSKPLKAPEIG